MIRKLLIPFLSLALLFGCVPPAAPELTLEMLRNATYVAPNTGRTVTLVDGSYESGSDPSAADYLQVTMSDLVAFGDLNYDGQVDAAILLAENTGGTGVFVSLIAVLNDGGAPLQAASVYIDDRPITNLLIIQFEEILLDAILHSTESPMCCPDRQTQQGYRLYAGQLVLTRLSSETPMGIMRTIDIVAPIDLEEHGFPLTLTGGVTVGPFENTLAYNVYAPDNTLVTAGSVMTDSPDMGLPGNFSLTLDLTMAGVTGLVRIEFVEYSMADGSVMVLDSVLVNVP